VLGHNYLLTFQERSTGIFEPVRERLRTSRAHIRELGVDYLAYSLLDSIVDRYFNVLEDVGEDSEALEEVLLHKPTNMELHSIHQLKHVSIELRRAVWPLREVINNLIRNENNFFKPTTMPYLRDVYDHTVNFIESLESIRDSLSGMMDIYMASVSNRVNLEVRALTVVAMLFMPATLIAGIFGMNFHEMPWLAEKNGFWWAMGLMTAIALIMILIFWRRQWLTSKT
jgi:magnesium transporter